MTTRCLLLAPCVLIACAADLGQPTDDPIVHADLEPATQDAPEVEMFFSSRNSGCEVPSLIVEAHARIRGALVENAICEFVFDDGTAVFAVGSESYGCEVDVELPRSGDYNVTVMIRDPESGAVGTLERSVFVYPVMTAELEVTAPECGLELSWSASAPEAAVVNVHVAPFDNIVMTDEAYYENSEYTMQVTEPGTYEVFMFAEQLRSSGGSCILGITKQVTVTECDHEHTPECGH